MIGLWNAESYPSQGICARIPVKKYANSYTWPGILIRDINI